MHKHLWAMYVCSTYPGEHHGISANNPGATGTRRMTSHNDTVRMAMPMYRHTETVFIWFLPITKIKMLMDIYIQTNISRYLKKFTWIHAPTYQSTILPIHTYIGSCRIRISIFREHCLSCIHTYTSNWVPISWALLHRSTKVNYIFTPQRKTSQFYTKSLRLLSGLH